MPIDRAVLLLDVPTLAARDDADTHRDEGEFSRVRKGEAV